MEASQANFDGATLEEVKFSRAVVARATFDAAQMAKADLVGVDASGSSFDRANLIEADFTNAVLADARFPEADLTKAKLTHVAASNVDFRRALLIEANFGGADLRGANFEHADVTGANFRGAFVFEKDVLLALGLHEVYCLVVLNSSSRLPPSSCPV